MLHRVVMAIWNGRDVTVEEIESTVAKLKEGGEEIVLRAPGKDVRLTLWKEEKSVWMRVEAKLLGKWRLVYTHSQSIAGKERSFAKHAVAKYDRALNARKVVNILEKYPKISVSIALGIIARLAAPSLKRFYGSNKLGSINSAKAAVEYVRKFETSAETSDNLLDAMLEHNLNTPYDEEAAMRIYALQKQSDQMGVEAFALATIMIVMLTKWPFLSQHLEAERRKEETRHRVGIYGSLTKWLRPERAGQVSSTQEELKRIK